MSIAQSTEMITPSAHTTILKKREGEQKCTNLVFDLTSTLPIKMISRDSFFFLTFSLSQFFFQKKKKKKLQHPS